MNCRKVTIICDSDVQRNECLLLHSNTRMGGEWNKNFLGNTTSFNRSFKTDYFIGILSILSSFPIFQGIGLLPVSAVGEKIVENVNVPTYLNFYKTFFIK